MVSEFGYGLRRLLWVCERDEVRVSIEYQDNNAASLSSVKYLVIKRMRRRTSVTSWRAFGKGFKSELKVDPSPTAIASTAVVQV